MSHLSLQCSRRISELLPKLKADFWYVPGRIEYGYEGECWVNPNEEEFGLWNSTERSDPDYCVFHVDTEGYPEDATKWCAKLDRERKKWAKIIVPAFSFAETIRLLPALAVKLKWEVGKVDVILKKFAVTFMLAPSESIGMEQVSSYLLKLLSECGFVEEESKN